MKQELDGYVVIFGVGLTCLLIVATITVLANTYLPGLSYETERRGSSHPLDLVAMAFACAYLCWAHKLARSKRARDLQLLRLIAAPGYLAILAFIVLVIIGPF